MRNEFPYHSVRSNKVIRLWWENYLLKAQTIAPEQIIIISELPFEAAKIPSLSCSLRNGSSASAPEGSEQFFSSWWSHQASGMAEEQAQHWTLSFTFSPLACPLPKLCHCGEESKDQFQGFTTVSLRQWLICFALQSPPWNSPKQGHRSKHLVGETVFSYSLPAGTVVAGPGVHAWSRFVSTTPALIAQVCCSPCVQT